MDVIIDNAKKTHLFDRCRVSVSGAVPFLKSAAGRETYDIVFLDPPYASGLLKESLALLPSILAPGASVVCECDTEVVSRRLSVRKDEDATAERVLQEIFGGDAALMAKYSLRRSTVYGRTRIALLSLADAENTGEAE